MEYWIQVFWVYPIIPLFHHSIIPYFLRVRDQPFHVPGIPFIYEDVFAQPSLLLGGLAGKKMTGIGFGTLDLPAAGYLESLCCPSICF
jgi:hypothetical protein